MKLKRLFVDMDGVLCRWKPAKHIEEIYEEGWFRNMEPQPNVIEAIRAFIELEEEHGVPTYVLSATPDGGEYAVAEKSAWLDDFIPEINAGHRIFTIAGKSKGDFVPFGVQPGDILMDDYSVNLHDWKAIGIKVMNGVNGSNGTWAAKNGPYIDANWPPETILYRLIQAVEDIDDEE